MEIVSSASESETVKTVKCKDLLEVKREVFRVLSEGEKISEQEINDGKTEGYTGKKDDEGNLIKAVMTETKESVLIDKAKKQQIADLQEGNAEFMRQMNKIPRRPTDNMGKPIGEKPEYEESVGKITGIVE